MRHEQVGWSRTQAPKGRVRGKSGLRRAKVPGNSRWRRLQGKCNRNRPPSAAFGRRTVRMERRGKSSPVPWRQGALCKPHLEQHRDGGHMGGPSVPQRWLELCSNARPRQMIIHDRTRLTDLLMRHAHDGKQPWCHSKSHVTQASCVPMCRFRCFFRILPLMNRLLEMFP